MIDEKALVRAVKRAMENAGTLPAKEAVKLVPADWHRICAFALGSAVESAKPKEAEGLKELAAACPTIVKAGAKLAAGRVSGKVVVGCYGDVPAAEFKRLAAMLSAAGDGR